MTTNGPKAFKNLSELYKNFKRSSPGSEPDSQSLMDEMLILSFWIGLLNTWGDSSDMRDILSWIEDTCKKRSIKQTCRKSPSECKLLGTIFKVLRLTVCVKVLSPIICSALITTTIQEQFQDFVFRSLKVLEQSTDCLDAKLFNACSDVCKASLKRAQQATAYDPEELDIGQQGVAFCLISLIDYENTGRKIGCKNEIKFRICQLCEKKTFVGFLDFELDNQASMFGAAEWLFDLNVVANYLYNKPQILALNDEAYAENIMAPTPEEICDICTDNFQPDKTISRLPCSHYYHRQCILPWLSKENNCPVCRRAISLENAGPEARSRRVAAGSSLKKFGYQMWRLFRGGVSRPFLRPFCS